MDLESLLVSVYALVDDWWREKHPRGPRKPGRPQSLSYSEVLTLAIISQWPRFRSERDFWRFADAPGGLEQLHSKRLSSPTPCG